MTDQYAVEDFIDAQQYKLDVNPDNLDLSYSMMRQAGLFAYYSTLAAKAQHQMDKMEQLEEIICARLDKKVRDDAIAAGTKITEAQVKAQILLQPKAIAVRSAVNRAREVSSICKSAADAFRHRRDMLIQLSFNEREEKKGELRVSGGEERHQAARENRAQRMEAMKNN